MVAASASPRYDLPIQPSWTAGDEAPAGTNLVKAHMD